MNDSGHEATFLFSIEYPETNRKGVGKIWRETLANIQSIPFIDRSMA